MASWFERHVVNRVVRFGARLGRDIDGVRELEVIGRRSGRPRRTPLKVLEIGGERYLVSLNGDAGWVRNLRARRTARLRFGRRVEHVAVIEVPDAEKLPVVRAYLQSATRPETVRRLAWAADAAPEAEVQRGAATVPVFRLAAYPRS